MTLFIWMVVIFGNLPFALEDTKIRSKISAFIIGLFVMVLLLYYIPSKTLHDRFNKLEQKNIEAIEK